MNARLNRISGLAAGMIGATLIAAFLWVYHKRADLDPAPVTGEPRFHQDTPVPLEAQGEASTAKDDGALLDPVTAVSGSGPGYVFYFIEALQQAALEFGFAPDQARQLAVQTFLGAARLAAESPEPLATLRERVTSKGGTTAAALAKFDNAGIRQAIVAGARAANARATEMGDELDAGAPPQPARR